MPVVSSRKYRWLRTFYAEKLAKRSAISLVPNPHYRGNKPNFKRVSVKLSVKVLPVACSSPVATLTLPCAAGGSTQRTEAGKQSQCGKYPSLRVTYLYLNNSKAPLNRRICVGPFPGLPIIRVWLTASEW